MQNTGSQPQPNLDGFEEIFPRVWHNSKSGQTWFDPIFGQVAKAEFYSESGWWLVYAGFQFIPQPVLLIEGPDWTEAEWHVIAAAIKLIRECLGKTDPVSCLLYEKRLPLLPMLYNVCGLNNETGDRHGVHGLYNQSRQKILLRRGLIKEGVISTAYYLVEEAFHAIDPDLCRQMSETEYWATMPAAEARACLKRKQFVDSVSRQPNLSTEMWESIRRFQELAEKQLPKRR